MKSILVSPPEFKSLLEGDELTKFLRNAKHKGTVIHHGIQIDAYTHKAFQNSSLFAVCGLGHTMHVLYTYEGDSDKSGVVVANDLISDFADFVLYERVESHATIN